MMLIKTATSARKIVFPTNIFQFPIEPTRHVHNGAELVTILQTFSSRWQTMAIHGSIEVAYPSFALYIPCKLLGINDVFGSRAGLSFVGVGDGGGTLSVFRECVMENLVITSGLDSEDDYPDDDDPYNDDHPDFAVIQVLSGAALLMKNCAINGWNSPACRVDGRASFQNCAMNSNGFLGLIAGDDSTVIVENCDLVGGNMWGCFLGADLSIEREKVIRSLNTCSNYDDGVTRMYEMTGVNVNPWHTSSS
jgi:hypothetical protein